MRLSFVASVAAGLAASAVSVPAWAGLSFVNVQRSVTAAAGNVVEPLELAQDVETVNAPGVAAERQISADAVFVDPDNDRQTANASQTSRIRNSPSVPEVRIAAEGDLVTTSQDEQALARSVFDTTFVLSEATPFTLEGSLRFEELTRGNRGNVTLDRVLDGGDQPVFAHAFDITDESTASEFATAGNLSAGRYRFTFDAIAFASIQYDDDADYDFSLVLAAPLDNGGGPNPIPLPPAAWASLVTFAGIGASRFLPRWRPLGR